ncbi:hypothetical protein AAMO2058_001530300 [Amorphochlora amoebiformis]|uniref:CSN8/PSMD8/EIF3K domain-containing protein n=1 Tax=Amorphochlora amoebiformis TaxID=1561963 RepID=A0A7S0DNC7_9EUKA|mmetsp:Transcript_35526/g.57335  ORF Transcript_35526/g.57335 Transcript_35526/m.57335 type:complete len:217 (+) Transcript_35526:242-892(+)
MSTPDIKALIDKHLYDSALIKPLEEHVAKQIKDNTSDFMANRHLLKLYKFHPGAVKADVAGQILLKAVMQLPSSDFISCVYLLPSDLHSQEPISTILHLASLLESFEMEKFWKTAQEQKGYPDLLKLPGFVEAIERFVVRVFGCTFCDVSVSSLEPLLKNGKSDVERLAKRYGWDIKDGIVVVSKRTKESTGEDVEGVGSAKITLQQVGKVLPLLQ